MRAFPLLRTPGRSSQVRFTPHGRHCLLVAQLYQPNSHAIKPRRFSPVLSGNPAATSAPETTIPAHRAQQLASAIHVAQHTLLHTHGGLVPYSLRSHNHPPSHPPSHPALTSRISCLLSWPAAVFLRVAATA